MDHKLKILHLEDVPTDAELVKRELKKGNINFELLVVDNKDAFFKALKDFTPDIILSDHNLPTLNSVDAIKLASETDVKVPVILVTGTMSEDFAVNVMKGGAADYILKDRLQRLPTAVLSAVEKIRLENDRQKFLDEVITNEALLIQTESLAHIGSWQSDLLRNITKWSDETFRIFGYKPKEIVPSFEKFINCVHPDDKDFVSKTIASAIQNLNTCKLNFRVKDKNGLIKYIYSELLIERNDNNEPVLIKAFNQDITEAKLAEEEIKQSHKQLRALAAHLQHIREEERTNIAREIHDELGQVLTSLKMNLIFLNKSISKNESIIEKNELFKEINSMTNVIDNTIKQIRKIITELRPEVLDNLGLIPALEWQIKEFNNRSRLKVDMSNSCDAIDVNKDISIAIYRILQEAFTNITRHSKATEVKVVIEKINNHFKMEIEDNGIGIDQAKLKRSKSFGVLGMRERAIILGGDFKIENVKPSGTKIMVNVPL
jgi:two-component system sensor histidine kinase UhpB